MLVCRREACAVQLILPVWTARGTHKACCKPGLLRDFLDLNLGVGAEPLLVREGENGTRLKRWGSGLKEATTEVAMPLLVGLIGVGCSVAALVVAASALSKSS